MDPDFIFHRARRAALRGVAILLTCGVLRAQQGGEPQTIVASGDGLQLGFDGDGSLRSLWAGQALPLAQSRPLVTLTDVSALLVPRSGEIQLAPNPSFELDFDRDGFPDGWSFVDFWGSGGSVAWDSSQASDGQHSLRFSGAGGEAVVSAVLSVAPGQRWIVQCDRRGDASVRTLVFWRDANGALIGNKLSDPQRPSPDFLAMGEVVVAPPRAARAEIGVQVLGAGDTWIDRVRVSAPDPAVHRPIDGPVHTGPDGFEQSLIDSEMGVLASLTLTAAEAGIRGRVSLHDLRGGDRAWSVEVSLPVEVDHYRVQTSPRSDERCDARNQWSEYQAYERAVWAPLGEERHSTYPLLSVTERGRKNGVALAMSPTAPHAMRLLVDGAPGHGLELRVPVATSSAVTGTRGRADVPFLLTAADAAFPFRSALQRVASLIPEYGERRFGSGGIWIPFTAPHTIPQVEDFGFAVHEGDNSVPEDDALGIASFVYLEPWDFWLPFGDLGGPPTYADAVARLGDYAGGGASDFLVDMARATWVGGHEAADGRFLHQMLQVPWVSGSGWSCLLSINPEPGVVDRSGQGWPSLYDVQLKLALDAYDRAERQDAVLDGTYLDSMSTYFGHALETRREGWRGVEAPLTWDSLTREVGLWPPAQVAVVAEAHADRERAEGRLVMGNSIVPTSRAASVWLDYLGIEANWGAAVESDETLLFRRVMAYRRPFCILQNTDFAQFDRGRMREYMRRCLFYGIYASCFSVDAASDPYWEDPALFERDRDLFLRFVPLVRELDTAGWCPVTFGSTTRRDVHVERYGESPPELFFTVLNDSDDVRSYELVIDKASLGIPDLASVIDRLSGDAFSFTQTDAELRIDDELDSGRVRMFQLQ